MSNLRNRVEKLEGRNGLGRVYVIFLEPGESDQEAYHREGIYPTEQDTVVIFEDPMGGSLPKIEATSKSNHSNQETVNPDIDKTGD